MAVPTRLATAALNTWLRRCSGSGKGRSGDIEVDGSVQAGWEAARFACAFGAGMAAHLLGPAQRIILQRLRQPLRTRRKHLAVFQAESGSGPPCEPPEWRERW